MACLAMIGPRQSCVAFSLHYGEKIMTKANLTTIDFLQSPRASLADVMKRLFTEGKYQLLSFLQIDSIAVFGIRAITTSPTASDILCQGLKWMVDLWIRADSYLLCASRRGSTSSAGSTGTGSCGAGRSDTLCST